MSVGSDAGSERALLAALLQRDGFAVPEAGLSPRPLETGAALAGAPQRRFWMQERVDATPGLNTLACLVRFDRPLTEAALSAALARLFARHEALRTRFEETEAGLVEHADSPQPPAIEWIEGSPGEFLSEPASQAIAMDSGPLWRVALFAGAAAADTLLLVFHHAVMDLAGARLFVEEFDALLAPQQPQLMPDPLQQADHAWWRRSDARRERRARDADYWERRLKGQPAALSIPAAGPGRTGKACLQVPLDLGPDVVAAVRRFAAARGTTPFFVFLAAYAAVLGRFALSEDVTVGTTVDNRDTPGAESIVGCLSDLIPLRCDLGGEPGFGVLVERLRQACGEDFEHTGLGFADIVEQVRPDRRAGVAPLFQALFNLLPVSGERPPALTPLPGAAARADLALELVDDGRTISGRVEARAGHFPAELAGSIAAALGCLLRHGMARPDVPLPDLPLIEAGAAAAEADRLNPPMPDAPTVSLSEILLARARSKPDAVALLEGQREVTLGELSARSRAFAERLVAGGVRKGEPVAIGLDRSIELAVATLGVLRAGGAAMLLDPAHPAERLAAILADSGARILIGRERPEWLDRKVGHLDPASVAEGPGGVDLPRLGPDDPAYVVYTSGSTGKPKGVVGLHRGMVNRLRWAEAAFPVGAGELACQKTTPAFVDFLAELFGPLLAGIPSVIADRATAQDPLALTELIRRERVTRIVLVPSLLRAWLDMVPDIAARLASLSLCVTSGEALPAVVAARFRAAVPGCRLVNLYGASEVSADATWHEVSGPEADPVPIGVPIPGNRVAVVDRLGRVLPVGAPGEIAIAGLGISGGYFGDPAMTADRFVDIPGLRPPDRGSETGSGRAFRTGDLGYWDGSGRLVCLGRRDRQVKIQGVRVEPLEIEAAIESHPGVRGCHVTDIRDGEGTVFLAAYVAAEGSLASGDLRAFLTRRLPRAQIPARFVFLDALPLGPAGKIDRSALPLPAVIGDREAEGSADEGAPRESPLEPLEAVIAAIWSEVLRRPVESPAAEFFEYGGGSLQAIVAMTRLGTALGRPVSVATLFEAPVLRELARRLSLPADGEALPEVRPEPATGRAPATSNQLWLWQEYCEDPARTAYNLSIAYRLDGALDEAALDAALRDLLDRHHALRTCLRAEAGQPPVQQVEAVPAWMLQRTDLSALPVPEAGLAALVETESQAPFAIDRDLPFRARLVRLGRECHALALTVHHVASDGWSGQILVQELAALYRARRDGTSPPPLPPLQLADVARWQQKVRPILSRQVDGYRETLAGAEAPRVAATVGVADAGDGRGRKTAVVPVPVAPEALERLEAFGRQRQASRFVTMLAVWAALLARFGGVDRPLLGFPQAGRNAPGLSSVVGFLANTVLFSVDLRDSPDFGQALAAARSGLLAALRHQDVPLAWIQATGDGWPEDAAGEAVRSMIVVEDLADWDLPLAGLKSELVSRPGSPEARVDLALLVTQTPAGPDLRIEYAPARIAEALAETLACSLSRLIAAAASGPDIPFDRLALLDPACEEASLARAGVGAVAAPGPEPVAHRVEGLLARAAAERPEDPAADDLQAVWSYARLHARASRVGAALRGEGVQAGDTVGLVASPGPAQLAALCGIWEAGATAVPVDPAYPDERILWLLSDAAAAAVLTERPLDHPVRQLPLDADAATAPPSMSGEPNPVAAIIYTSGTTGRPKGVPVSHEALCRLGSALAEAYGIGPGDRVLQVVSPAFDVALSDVAMTLSAGAALVMPPREAVLPGRSLAETLDRANITHMQAPAAILAATRPERSWALRTVAVGGEVCAPATLGRWAEGRRLFIAYGPTETTVTVSLARYAPGARTGTIGRPFCGAAMAVLDAGGHPVPPGVAGELVIGGPGVTTGYLRRPELTAERFLAGPAGGRRYRTGDRVRQEADGTFTFLGRMDRQVKLRGFRIEPGEVEAALMACPGVARALVDLRRDGAEETSRLIAWVVPEAGSALNLPALRRTLRRGLPDHLVPGTMLEIDAVPLTPNGKVDWAALPLPVADDVAEKGTVAAPVPATLPADETEFRQLLLAQWRDLLPGRPQIGLDSSFFDVGGHSLLVVRLQERLESRLGVALPVGELFANPTIRSLAAMLFRRLQAERAATSGAYEEFVL